MRCLGIRFAIHPTSLFLEYVCRSSDGRIPISDTTINIFVKKISVGAFCTNRLRLCTCKSALNMFDAILFYLMRKVEGTFAWRDLKSQTTKNDQRPKMVYGSMRFAFVVFLLMTECCFVILHFILCHTNI